MKDDSVTTAEPIIDELAVGFSRNDLEGVVSLFAQDATLESYVVSRVLNRKEGVCRGHAEIREVVRALMKHGVPWGDTSSRSFEGTPSPSSSEVRRRMRRSSRWTSSN
jgi:hypothetical protein